MAVATSAAEDFAEDGVMDFVEGQTLLLKMLKLESGKIPSDIVVVVVVVVVSDLRIKQSGPY